MLTPAAGTRAADRIVESLVPAGFEAYVRIFHPATRFGARVRGREIAIATGSTPHAGMQFPNLAGTWSRAVPGVCDRRPGAGNRPGPRRRRRGAPTFQVPARGYPLLWGGIDAVTEPVEREPPERSQSIGWPDDRAWCVAAEIDLDTTFVGCSGACAAALVGSADLEAFEVDPTWYLNDDRLNAEPPLAS